MEVATQQTPRKKISKLKAGHGMVAPFYIVPAHIEERSGHWLWNDLLECVVIRAI